MANNLSKHLDSEPSEREVQVASIMQAPEESSTQALLSIAKKMRDDEDRQFRLHPKIDVDITNDFRYRLGVIEGMDRILRLPQEAQDLYQKAQSKE